MRIYRRKEFMKLPAGTAFFKGKQWYFGGIQFKGDTITDGYGNRLDWYELDPAWVDGYDSGECLGRLEEMLSSGAKYPMQDSECRDGRFDDEDLFLVPDKIDLAQIKEWLDTAIAVCD